MEDKFLANSLVVYVEGEIVEKHIYDDIIADFKKMKKRRAGHLIIIVYFY
jgi:hypothetical protein